MTGGEILIPCPNCKALVRYDSDVQIDGVYDACLICGTPFSRALRKAIAQFLADAQDPRRKALDMNS
jgi:hypothetical protein